MILLPLKPREPGPLAAGFFDIFLNQRIVSWCILMHNWIIVTARILAFTDWRGFDV